MTKFPFFLAVALQLGLGLGHISAADEPKETLTFHTAWKGERIELPPRFAPAMTLKGIEEIRFAPGMFDAKSDSFFTYAFVFSVPKEQELSPDVIQREMLAYYRGLGEAVSKSRGKPVDGGKFTFKLDAEKEATGAPEKIPAGTKVTQYAGELDWTEPFATGQPQLLHFELQAWADVTTGRNYLFVCASPKARTETDAVWKELRQIRRSFEVAGK
jgi:hypothetical protein